MFGPEGEADERGGPASPRTTIVGGRPPEAKAGLPPVPIGLERLLRLAATDAAFAAELVKRRAAVAGVAGVELTRNEAAILAAIPAAQLEAMIARVPPPAPPRRDFLQMAAASAVVALGGAALASCDGCPMTMTRGVQPDLPPERPDANPMSLEGGAAPHEPPPRPDDVVVPQGNTPDMPPPQEYKPPEAPQWPRPDAAPRPTGIVPDLPPPRPQDVPMQSSGGAAPDVPPPRPSQSHPTRGIRSDDPGFK
jgi:hypothetical protein